MAPLRDRPTADVVIVIFTMVVAFVVITITLVTVISLLTGNFDHLSNVLQAVGDLTGSLIALIVGYVAGRGTNGNDGRGSTPGS